MRYKWWIDELRKKITQGRRYDSHSHFNKLANSINLQLLLTANTSTFSFCFNRTSVERFSLCFKREIFDVFSRSSVFFQDLRCFFKIFGVCSNLSDRDNFIDHLPNEANENEDESNKWIQHAIHVDAHHGDWTSGEWCSMRWWACSFNQKSSTRQKKLNIIFDRFD